MIHDGSKSVFANQAYADIFGYRNAEEILADDSPFNHVMPHEHERIMGYSKTRLSGGDAPSAYEFEGKRRDGTPIWLDNRVRVVSWDGRPAVQRTVVDITERKQAEIALRNSEELLLESARLAKLGHMVWDPYEDRCIYCSEIYAEMHGVTVEEFISRASAIDGDYGFSHPDDREKVRAMSLEVRNGMPVELEYRLLNPSGEKRFVHSIMRPVFDDEGTVIEEHEVLQDISERKRAEESLQAALVNAEHANQAKSEFLAHMSHELRTPLNSVIGFSQMMMAETFGPLGHANYLDYSGDIHSSAVHLLNVISDILDISKIEAGEMKIADTDFNIGSVVQESTKMVSDRANRSGIILGMEIDRNLPSLCGDKLRIKQIILNLLTNAIKFTPRSGRVSVRIFTNGGGIVLQVADTGAGIPADQLSNILRPFEQVRDSSRHAHEGTGLGLYLTNNLIQLHGGVLKIESEVGKGTTATVSFPPERTVRA